MKTVKLNFCVRKPNPSINYNFTDSIILGNSPVNFHPEILVKEVNNLSIKGKMKLKKVAMSFLTTAGTFLMLSSKSMAASLKQGEQIPVSGIMMPPELMQLMLTILVIVVAIGIILSAILMASAGIMKMLGKKRRKEAEEWSVDIIKGFIQVILSAPVIFLLYYIASTLLKSSGWFISPF